LLDSEKIK
jgi:hypothetical protein